MEHLQEASAVAHLKFGIGKGWRSRLPPTATPGAIGRHEIAEVSTVSGQVVRCDRALLRSSIERLRPSARELAKDLGHFFNDEEQGEAPFYDKLASYGAVMIDLCRHGQAAVSAERVIDESVDKLPLGASPPSISTADGAFHKLKGGRSKFERENVQRP